MRYLAFALFSLVLVSSLQALTIHVPGDSTTIYGGISGAEDGDTVLVAPGTYYDRYVNFLGKAILVKSEQGPLVTIIDAVMNGSVVTFNSEEQTNSVLDGFTITNGRGYGDNWGSYGGGIFCGYNCSPTIRNNIITGNKIIVGPKENGYGGGIYSYQGSPIIENNIIHGNSADEGSGIHCNAGSEARIINNTIYKNSDSYGGSGIYCRSASPAIINNIIERNGTLGIFCYNSSPLIAGNLISRNGPGGGSGIAVSFNSHPLIINSTIVGNGSIQGSYDVGNGIHIMGGSPTVVNTIIHGRAGQTGPQISIDGASLTISYSDVEGGQDSVYVENGTLNWGEGNIDADPLFVSFYGFDFLLHPTSPCVDAGKPSIEDGISDWHPRWPDWYPNGSRSDMGAYGGPGNDGWLH